MINEGEALIFFATFLKANKSQRVELVGGIRGINNAMAFLNTTKAVPQEEPKQKRRYTKRHARRKHKRWNMTEEKQLRELIKTTKSWKRIAQLMGRTKGSVKTHASEMKLRDIVKVK